MPTQYLGVLLHTMAISGLPRVRTELDPLLIIPSLAHHPVQTNCQPTRHGDFGDLPSPPHHQVKVSAAPFRKTAHCNLSRFHQQEAQDRTSLLGDVSQPSPIPAGVFQWNQTEIAGHLLATLKAFASPMISTNAIAVSGPTPGCVASRCASGHFSTSCSTAWLSSAMVGFNRSSNSSRSRRRRLAHGARLERFQLLAFGPPQPLLTPQTFVQRHRLQLIHDARTRLHHAVAMP